MNLQDWCSKWCISINSMKTNYMVFYDKSNKAPPVQIPITIDGNRLRNVSSQRVLGIIIDEELSFTSHLENINKKINQAYNRLTHFTGMGPHLHSVSQYFETFQCFTRFFFHHKSNHGRLLLINMLFTSCLTRCQTI